MEGIFHYDLIIMRSDQISVNIHDPTPYAWQHKPDNQFASARYSCLLVTSSPFFPHWYKVFHCWLYKSWPVTVLQFGSESWLLSPFFLYSLMTVLMRNQFAALAWMSTWDYSTMIAIQQLIACVLLRDNEDWSADNWWLAPSMCKINDMNELQTTDD